MATTTITVADEVVIATADASAVFHLSQSHGLPPSQPKTDVVNEPTTTGPTSPIRSAELTVPESNSDEQQYPHGTTFWLLLFCLVLAIIFINMDTAIVATAVPAITDEFHTVADVGWYSAGYRLCACSFQFIFGKMYTLFPIRRIFLCSLAIFIAGSVLSTLAPTSSTFAIARALSGVGTAGVMQGCFTALMYLVPLRKRSMLTGIFNAAETVSGMAAPSIGGAIISRLSWRWCFGINIPIGVFTLVVIGFTLKVDNGARGLRWREAFVKLDVIGNLLFIPSLCCLFLALSWAGTKYSWGSATVIGLLVAFVGSFMLYVWHERRRGDAATLPTRLLKNRSVFAAAMYILCSNSASAILEYYMPTYFQVVRQTSPLRSGVLMLPALFGYLSAVLIGGAGISLLGYYAPFMWLATILMPTSSGLMTTWSLTTSLGGIAGYSFLMGIGTGIGFQGPQTAVQTVLPQGDVSLGIAVVLFSQSFGPAVAMAVGQTLLTNALLTNFRSLDPALTAKQVNQMGLSQLKTLVPQNQQEAALMAINKSLMQTWYLPVGLSCATVIGSALIEWKSVKEKRN